MSFDPRSFQSQNQPPSRPAPPFGAGTFSPPPLQPQSQPVGQPAGKKIGGILAALGILILKFFSSIKLFLIPILKFLPLILKTGGSMFLMIGVYAMFWGWKWALGFVILLLLHECGHLIAARQLGLKVGAPVFIPFMGAFIALKEAPRNAWIEAWVGIGGPLFGSFAAVVCHSLGETLNSPLLISLALTGYFLNLFNLTPVGQLDGGRIVSALSPWFWLPGFGVMAWMAWQSYVTGRFNIIILLVLLFSLPRVFSLFRKRTAEEERYFEVQPAQRWTIGLLYFGLIAALAYGMHVAQGQLQEHHIGRHGGTQVAAVQ